MIRCITGYICVEVRGEKISSFINACRKNMIELKNIRHSGNRIYAEIRNADLIRCRSIAFEKGLDFSVLKRFGVKVLISAYRGRIIFVFVFLIALALFALNSACISDIKITGNEKLSESQIKSILKSNGLEEGIFKFGIDQREFKEEVMKSCHFISWIWLEIKGTVAFVEIREKVPVPGIFDRNYACNIIASNDGVVKSAIASGGILYAKVGEYVKKGDLLVGGVYDSQNNAPVRFVHASGEIFATTFYESEGVFSNKYIKYSKGEKKIIYGFEVGNLLFDREIHTPSVLLSNDSKKKIKIFGKFYLPLAFTKKEYCEIIESEYKVNDTLAKEYAVSELSRKFLMTLPEGAAVVNTKKEFTQIDEEKFHLKLVFECVENIGVESPIEFTYR